MNNLFLAAVIAGEPVAVAAREIETVIRIAEIVAVPGVPPIVAGLHALRSRVITVIDCARCIGETTGPAPCGSPGPRAAGIAIVADVEGHGYGFLVDAVEDVMFVEAGLDPLVGPIAPAWRSMARGLVTMHGRPRLMVELAGFLGPASRIAA